MKNRDMLLAKGFNTQPPEGGWLIVAADNDIHLVSTRSRPKAAGQFGVPLQITLFVSTRSRPKAAGVVTVRVMVNQVVSTRSRPKAAGGPSAQ